MSVDTNPIALVLAGMGAIDSLNDSARSLIGEHEAEAITQRLMQGGYFKHRERERIYRQQFGKLPGSNRTARLRKKRRTLIAKRLFN